MEVLDGEVRSFNDLILQVENAGCTLESAMSVQPRFGKDAYQSQAASLELDWQRR